jgi:integrase
MAQGHRISGWKVMTQKSRKPNGHGYTYKNGNSYRTVIQHNGRTITASAKTAQESRRLAKEKVLSIPLNAQGLLLKQKKTTLGVFLNQWLEIEHKQNIAHSTYARYRSLTKTHIIPHLGEVLIQNLTPRLITWFLNEMRESGQSPRSQQQARALLSIALKAAEEQEIIASNPVKKVRNPQLKQKNISPLTIEEVKLLLTTYEGTYLSARLHIALLCGLRQGEALGLRWEDIDFKRDVIQIRQQMQKIDGRYQFTQLKTHRSQRDIAIGSGTHIALQKHRELVQEMQDSSSENWHALDLVFPNSTGAARSPMSDYDQWQNALKLCGISPRRLHDARHTAATIMYSQNIDIETISRALGHSSSAITSRLYVHSAQEPLRNAANILNSLFM